MENDHEEFLLKIQLFFLRGSRTGTSRLIKKRILIFTFDVRATQLHYESSACSNIIIRQYTFMIVDALSDVSTPLDKFVRA